MVAARAPQVTSPMVLSGVVEVDDEADSAAGRPDADPDAVVFRIHQVDVVAAVVRALALEEEVRREDRGPRIAGPTAEVLRPPIARVARRLQPVGRAAADEMAAQILRRQHPGVRTRDLRADPGVELEGRD